MVIEPIAFLTPVLVAVAVVVASGSVSHGYLHPVRALPLGSVIFFLAYVSFLCVMFPNKADKLNLPSKKTEQKLAISFRNKLLR